MIPLDVAIVRRVEQIDARRHVLARVVVDVVDQPALPGQADDRRQERLRDAVRHVHARRLAPFGDDVAVSRHEAGCGPPIPHGPDNRAVRLLAEAVGLEQHPVFR